MPCRVGEVARCESNSIRRLRLIQEIDKPRLGAGTGAPQHRHQELALPIHDSGIRIELHQKRKSEKTAIASSIPASLSTRKSHSCSTRRSHCVSPGRANAATNAHGPTNNHLRPRKPCDSRCSAFRSGLLPFAGNHPEVQASKGIDERRPTEKTGFGLAVHIVRNVDVRTCEVGNPQFTSSTIHGAFLSPPSPSR